MSGLSVGTSAGVLTATEIHIGTAGGVREVTEGWVGTAGGNVRFHAAAPPAGPLDASIFAPLGWELQGDFTWACEVACLASGGTWSYSYAWSVLSGPASFDNGAVASTMLRAAAGPPPQVVIRCVIDDGAATVAPEAVIG